ncbi:hypothetical protein FQN54_002628 [Arachnomyces sp. PD_36]|nr:hypothetical protein FQN54_002628 [Arachnomyces sp. PD_36]
MAFKTPKAESSAIPIVDPTKPKAGSRKSTSTSNKENAAKAPSSGPEQGHAINGSANSPPNDSSEESAPAEMPQRFDTQTNGIRSQGTGLIENGAAGINSSLSGLGTGRGGTAIAPTLNLHGLATRSVHSSKPSQDTGQWKPDIYAGSYIPAYLLAINESPSIEYNCTALDTINFQKYVSSFAGSDFLQPMVIEDMPNITSIPISLSRFAKNLIPSNYFYYFDECLLLEAAKNSTELEDYNLYDMELHSTDPRQQLYNLRVPGLRDDAPSVELGDTVLVRQIVHAPNLALLGAAWLENRHLSSGAVAPGFTGHQHRAVVWGVSRAKETIVLRIDKFIPSFPRCNIKFVVQPNTFLPLWRAVLDINGGHPSSQSAVTEGCGVASNELTWLRHMLFPSPGDAVIQRTLPNGSFKLNWIDNDLNYEQMKAVDSVVSRNYGDIPFLISGIPGSGKTKTIVECALQLLQSYGKAEPHILMCAPSNPAADTLALRLARHLQPKDLFRLNGWTRTFAEVPDQLLPYTFTDNDLFSLPSFEKLMKYKIVVTTCRDADMLIQARLTNRDLMKLGHRMFSSMFQGSDPPQEDLLHWTALLVDEAAQATEPSVCVPLNVVSTPLKLGPRAVLDTDSSPHPIFVMAGDQHQLGPRVSNDETALSVSLFERLFSLPVYADHPLSRRNGPYKRLTQAMLPIPRPAFTNLTRNYRSHPAILSVPSALFYNDTIIPSAVPPDPQGPVPTWPRWQQPHRWPVLFSCITSPDEVEDILQRSGGSGLFNRGEALKALDIAKSLLEHSRTIDYDSILPSSPTTSPARPITQEEITIATPFRTQVAHLREVFRANNLYSVNIGPLEAFQGLETRFLIICTTRTRSEEKFIHHDQAMGLGIIGEKRRFNVALTRAKEGLVVIGNPEVLSRLGKDESWRAFLGFCARNGCWEVDKKAKGVHQGRKYWVNQLCGKRWGCSDNGESKAAFMGHVSRLERGLLLAEQGVEDGEDENNGAKGKGSLGRGQHSYAQDDYDAAMWTSGMVAEEVLRGSSDWD